MQSKIAGTIISVLFALYGLLIAVDYFLPYSRKVAMIESILKEEGSSYRRRGYSRHKTSPSYTIKIDGESIATDAETFQKDNGAENAMVFRTKFLQRVIRLETTGFQIHIYEAPFVYFPLIPILFILPLFAWRIKRQDTFFKILRPGSLLLACILLVMSFT